ncbi:MAG: DUF952 domain-containing protein [Gemmatimonadaceae bacterium]|nr:DUF952 domain-containing protein [Chitinophagaceae bacterium]
MPIIYHLTTAAEWDAARKTGKYESPSLANEGFIHCSEQSQVAATLQRYFQGKENVLKLVIDTDKLSSPFIFEWSPSTADTFPHIYGPINIDAVVGVETM